EGSALPVRDPTRATEDTPRRRFAASALKHVNGKEDDQPHNVDEVPVDPRHLDTQVILRLRAEVASEGADRGEAEEQEADEDVGSVEAGEAVEDRPEGEVAGAEADVRVLVDLDEEEGGAEHPGRDQTEFQALVIATAD